MKTVQVKTVERRLWCDSCIFNVKYEHVSHFVLIANFEQTSICWVQIENTKTFEGDIRHIMHYVVVFSV